MVSCVTTKRLQRCGHDFRRNVGYSRCMAEKDFIHIQFATDQEPAVLAPSLNDVRAICRGVRDEGNRQSFSF